ncbi:hypothetical protein CR155_14735 [Pollutimonas nitritireducens]|uniref:DUF2946 family protein n=1 Tax=Pollutimonas nitritireducens TaxID=2045209 RepID=A0A2N4UDG1_9BURK|nr:DUF2946 family protein [Pollutimonas nitritireducens]PLC53056.1 hypothetical protein CR155_14735 [Pollutimonas nitritireducens]
MDENVIAAMARWPNVPDVYGWLSLTASGQWRLHPAGDAWQSPRPSVGTAPQLGHDGRTGESISSDQIIRFIDRNYTHDHQGRWFFQNGPQRVYVRLDAAPYILLTGGSTGGDGLSLTTHTGLDVATVQEWWLDDNGRLYAHTEHGPGLVAGRDLPSVLDALYTTEGVNLMAALEADSTPSDTLTLRALGASTTPAANAVPFRTCPATDIPTRLGFVANPHPEK